MAFTKADKKFLKDTFATKDDIKAVLKPVKQSLKKMNNKLDTAIRFFDNSTINHEKRMKRVEHHLNLPPIVD